MQNERGFIDQHFCGWPELPEERRLTGSFSVPSRGERATELISSYLCRLSDVLSRQLGNNMAIQNEGFIESAVRLGENARFIRPGHVVVSLRVYCEALEIILPYEVVHNLTLTLLEREASRVLLTPDKEALTVLSFFVAKVLAEEEMFTHQGVYLTGAYLCDTAEKSKSHLVRIDEKREIDAVVMMQVRAYSEGAEYPCLVVLSSELVQRVQNYARLVMNVTTSRWSYLRAAKTRWKLVLSIDMGSMITLLHLSPGQFFPLSDIGKDSVHGRLEQIIGERKGRKGDSMSKKTAEVDADLLSGSRTGVCRLQLKL